MFSTRTPGMPWDFAKELAAYGPGASSPANRLTLPAARAYCRRVTLSHYENFSVASLLLPRRLHLHFHAVYAYCRWADDLADETAGGPDALRLLDWWQDELDACYAGQPRHPVMVALHDTVQQFDIPIDPFRDLLVAFRQDQRVKRYARFEELLGYCRYSANPVGQIVLYLFKSFDARRARLADEICTGLQLANFWQDVARDAALGRLYLPAEDLDRFGVAPADVFAGRCTPAFRELLEFEVHRTRAFFDRGEALLPLLPRAARMNVALFVGGGRAVLRAIERAGFDVLSHRPTVTRAEKLRVLARSAATHWLNGC